MYGREFYIAVIALFCVGLSGCEKPKGLEYVEVDRKYLQVHADKQTLRHDDVGVGRFRSRATFVLVDVENRYRADLFVTLGGELVDAKERTVGTLRAESLRIPPASQRVFALIDNKNEERKSAVRANIRITGAHQSKHPVSIQITDGNVYPDADRVVVNAYARNTSKERFARVVVLGAFYDAQGAPMTRPFIDLQIPPNGKHPVQFVGPNGSRKASVFVGQIAY